MITSTSNAKVKRLVNLKKKKKLRDEEGVFLVEGLQLIIAFLLMVLGVIIVISCGKELFHKKAGSEVSHNVKEPVTR